MAGEREHTAERASALANLLIASREFYEADGWLLVATNKCDPDAVRATGDRLKAAKRALLDATCVAVRLGVL